jgi:hypothetical protein
MSGSERHCTVRGARGQSSLAVLCLNQLHGHPRGKPLLLPAVSTVSLARRITETGTPPWCLATCVDSTIGVIV